MAVGVKTQASSPRGVVNRIQGIAPTFSDFDVNPSNPERITDNDFTTVTGEGTKSLAGVNGNVGTIYFDMGVAYSVTVQIWMNAHRNLGDGTLNVYIEFSDDAITYYPSTVYFMAGFTLDQYRPAPPMFLYARYFRLRLTTSAVTVNPSVFHVKVAEVQALQFL